MLRKEPTLIIATAYHESEVGLTIVVKAATVISQSVEGCIKSAARELTVR